ncbi:MAG: sigma-54-dependent Fis family transcriptional regulator [SAR324 cluster bacterium]|nr:sigma-54-dependent Fis family transcriptional regulator [SAR324 cluster bacterium]
MQDASTNETVLVIDDDELVQEMLFEFLSDSGYRVLVAANGQTALEIYERESPNVIITDLRMPEMDGIGFLKKLPRKTAISPAVIVLTGYDTMDELDLSYDLGVYAFLRKPANLHEISGIVRNAAMLCSYDEQLRREKDSLKQAYITIEEEQRANQKMHRELEEKHLVLQKTFESMAEGVAVLDTLFQIHMISHKACKILGVEETSVLNKPAAAILGTEIAGPSGELIKNSPIREPLYNISTNLLSPSGTVIPVQLSIIPLEPEIYPGWMLLFRDIRNEEKQTRETSGGIRFGKMISCDSVMHEIFSLVDKVALSNATVLIEGESGTGKDVLAREIHARSHRAQGPFHTVNCAAISPHLLESEFFGHERGAFTGASYTKQGRFELANNGTLFLDEVGEIPLELQGKLLRVLQDRSFERVGGTKTIQVNVRIIAATNRDLKQLTDEKLFRTDLYFRLHVVPFRLPALRDRIQDLHLLIQQLIQEFNKRENRNVKGVDKEVLQRFLQHSWPGNIRELYHLLEYAFAVSSEDTLMIQHFPPEFIASLVDTQELPIPDSEREFLLQALQRVNFRKSKAAALVGMHRSTFYRKMKKYGLQGS